MRIGIIAEGTSDIAVIMNILKGITGLEYSQFVPLQPKTSFDRTHLAHLDPDQKGGWSLIKKECIEKNKIGPFFALSDSSQIVIHLDAAEAEDYPVVRPDKNYHEYCRTLRSRIVEKINEWLGEDFGQKILYAIAIEETDAWILVLFDLKPTCAYLNPKKRLGRALQKKNEDSTITFDNYLRLSKPIQKTKNHLTQNCSLELFCEDARNKIGV